MADMIEVGDSSVPKDVLWNDHAARFEAFNSDHPAVMTELVRMTYQAKWAGRTKIGIGMLFEVIRWNRLFEGLPDLTEGSKLNNNYRSHFARRIMADHPALDGMFETRELRTL